MRLDLAGRDTIRGNLILLWTATLTLVSTAATPAEEPIHVPTAEWPTAREWSAPEAHQAAAADERFVYAITNTHVAKYERDSGQRVAGSTGEAKHLNSGFFHQGRLYCAHSNFPATPESSQIKVLDVESMRLTTHHDFGDYGGSLTWAVRHDKAWWCNFARYGNANDQTFLARFDDEWRETGRWTYPAEVISRLGRYSLSGGLWHRDHLLVTGHDDAVVFRLKLPEEGKVLRFVDRQAVPFAGQGIAADPVTGGLVGIQRSQRKIVLATPPASEPLRLRVLSYNIHRAEGIDRRLDIERIAKVIRSVRPDLVALQEIDQKTRRSRGMDQPAELKKLTGLHSVFGDNIEFDGGLYGNMVLSRYPIRRTRKHRLPRFNDGEQRGLLETEITLPGDRPPILFLATHLDHRGDDQERVASAKQINELIRQHADVPALLAGDLNDVPDSRTLTELGKQWHNPHARPQPTIPVQNPTRQIDFVLIRPAERWTVVETRVLEEAVASDHRAVLAILELKPEPRSPVR